MFSDKRQHFHFQLQSPICSYLVAQLTMAFQELMRKNNLLGGRYSAPPSCPLPSTSSPSPPPTSADPTPRNLKSPSPKRKRPNVVTTTVVHSNNRIQTTTGFMVMEARNAELYENFEPNDIGPVLQMSTKQRKTADRLKDPIVDKTQKRKPKTNLNAFKAQFLTLKKKISALQMEVGTEPDFLLLVKNNLQDPKIAKPSKMAGKYMAFGKGDLSDCFFSSGIKFDTNNMYKLANNFNYDEEETEGTSKNNVETVDESENRESIIHTRVSGREDNRNTSSKEYQPKTAQSRPKTALKPTRKPIRTITPANFRPRKVFTPGYFNHFENEDESEKERGNHSNIDEELQNIEGRESSMEDKAEEQIEEPSSSDNEM